MCERHEPYIKIENKLSGINIDIDSTTGRSTLFLEIILYKSIKITGLIFDSRLICISFYF